MILSQLFEEEKGGRKTASSVSDHLYTTVLEGNTLKKNSFIDIY